MLDEVQRLLKIGFDLAALLAFEKLRTGCYKRLHYPHTIRAGAAACFCNLPFCFCPVFALRRNQMKIQVTADLVNVWIAGVFLLDALVVGFNAPDFRPLVFGEAKDTGGRYFGHLVADNLSSILRDIREGHRADALTADDDLSAAAVQKQLLEAVHFEGSSEEKKIRAYLATLGIDYDTLTKEEFVSLMGILKKSTHMKSPISQRGKATMTHGKGKRKKR